MNEMYYLMRNFRNEKWGIAVSAAAEGGGGFLDKSPNGDTLIPNSIENYLKII